MPINPTYPGVYIEEVPSGVRTIVGVPTSITAFIGRAARGPVNEPVTITSYADYERIFGGLANYSTMSFVVRDFFLNGGSRAIIVRLFRPLVEAGGNGEVEAQGAANGVARAGTRDQVVTKAEEIQRKSANTQAKRDAAEKTADLIKAKQVEKLEDPEDEDLKDFVSQLDDSGDRASIIAGISSGPPAPHKYLAEVELATSIAQFAQKFVGDDVVDPDAVITEAYVGVKAVVEAVTTKKVNEGDPEEEKIAAAKEAGEKAANQIADDVLESEAKAQAAVLAARLIEETKFVDEEGEEREPQIKDLKGLATELKTVADALAKASTPESENEESTAILDRVRDTVNGLTGAGKELGELLLRFARDLHSLDNTALNQVADQILDSITEVEKTVNAVPEGGPDEDPPAADPTVETIRKAVRALAEKLLAERSLLTQDEIDAIKRVAAAMTSVANDANAETIFKAATTAVKRFHTIRAKLVTRVNGEETPFLEAASPGAWGNQLRARVTHDEDDDKLFNLLVTDGVSTEEFAKLSTEKESTQWAKSVLEERSDLVRWITSFPENTRPTKHPDLAPGEAPFSEGGTPGKYTAVKPSDRAGDGEKLISDDFDGPGTQRDAKGLYALTRTDLFNLLCIPPYDGNNPVDAPLLSSAAQLCEAERAMLLVDSPPEWTDVRKAQQGFTKPGGAYPNLPHKNAAIFFPLIKKPNPLKENRLESFVPCGAIAGIFARTDATRGVWKAPAGLDATIAGISGLTVELNDRENGILNPIGLNCLRTFPVVGQVVWGTRTLRGADRLADIDNKYIPVRRLTLFIEESLYRGTHFAVFEPNGEPLWASLRLAVGAFMQNLFRQGAFFGKTPKEAYFVKCDKDTNPQSLINLGIVTVEIGFAPLKPAEFVILRIQQMTGDLS